MQKRGGGGGGVGGGGVAAVFSPPPARGGERGRCFFPPPRLLQIARVCFISASSQSFESLAQPILPGGIVYHVAISKS